MNQLEKKRILLTDVEAMAKTLMNMSADIAKLELYDNWLASSRVVSELITIKNQAEVLKKKIRSIKGEINIRKGKKPPFAKKQVTNQL